MTLREEYSAWKPRTLNVCRGFTLLEIVLVIALIGLMVGVFATVSVNLLDKKTARSPEDIFFQAVQNAQELAIRTEHPVVMRFDAREKKLIWGENSPKPASAVFGEGTSVQFLPSGKSGSSILLGGQVVETQERPTVTFFSDGTCEPFRVQVRTKFGAAVTGIDPWTCAPILEKKS